MDFKIWKQDVEEYPLFYTRWADKSLSVIQYSNGHGGVNCDHSPIDAMVTVVMSYFIHLGVTDMGGKWPHPDNEERFIKILLFKLSNENALFCSPILFSIVLKKFSKN